jgi:hypothetical protein
MMQAAARQPAIEGFSAKALFRLQALASIMLQAEHVSCLDLYVQVGAECRAGSGTEFPS